MPPLNVIIIGAGISGLTAAAALRREGHHITILEKSSFNQETGAAIHVPSNVSGFLADLGFDFERTGAVKLRGMINHAVADGKLVMKVDMEQVAQAQHWKNQYYLIHRIDLHDELKRLATGPAGKSPVPKLLLGVRIDEIDAASGTVKLDDGTTLAGDLIVGADGNRSISRLQIKPDATLVPWGKTCYRWLTPKDSLMADEVTKDIFEEEGVFGEFSDKDRRIVFYPCRNNTTINVAAFVPDEETAAIELGSNKKVVQRAYSHAFPGVLNTLSHAEEDIKAWGLYDMEIMSEWNTGKLVLIGDAAHPFLPFLGMGGSMAIEDAACVAALLPEETTAAEVEGRLSMYQQIRHERATFAQTASKINGMDAAKRPRFNFFEAMMRCVNFDEWENTKQKLQEFERKRTRAR